jgi:hypothetical protein
MKKVMIATPAYDGRVHVPYAISLSETTMLLLNNGVQVAYNITTSGSLLVAERNRILKLFMQSDATHLLCVDSDLGWVPQFVLKMLLADKEFIAGVYPGRDGKSFTFRTFNKDDSSIVEENGLLKMQYIPAGFMLMTRSVVEKLMKKFPELYFEPKHESMKKENGWLFFNTELWDGEFWGEDYVFCRKAREAGVDIWVDPLIQFDHAGVKGKLLDVLTDKPEQKQQEQIA